MQRCLLTLLLLSGAPWARGEVRLPALIGDHMVLLAGGPAHLWGWASPGERVSAEFGGQKIGTTTGVDGRWNVWFRSLPAGPAGTLVITGANRLEVHDVLVGEVWLCSGQSNMERAVRFSKDYESVLAHADNPSLRLFQVEHSPLSQASEDVKGHWVVASAKTIPQYPAAAYFFGDKLQRARKVPVGIVTSVYGGTKIESWTSPNALDSHPELAFVRAAWQHVLETLPQQMAAWQQKVDAWKKTASAADVRNFEAGKGVAGAPGKPEGPGSRSEPSSLYNGMIAPLTGYSLRGIVWNQGENNSGQALEYRPLLKALIEDWRIAFGQGDLPFFVVQLSRYKPNFSYALMRESQLRALALRNTGLIVTADLGMVEDVHYPDKATQGERIFDAVQHDVYGERQAGSGPLLTQLTLEGDVLRLWFRDADGGLVLKAPPVPEWGALGPSTPPELSADGKAIVLRPLTAEQLSRAFLVAGRDGVFHPAQASIDGDTLLLHSAEVPQPEQVCYAWADTIPAVPLWNGAGLPASPFRAALDPRHEPACPDSANGVEAAR